jgi:hypothetical protein
LFFFAKAGAEGRAPSALSQDQAWWASPQWKALLHAGKDWRGRLRSEADSPDFFAHPDGKYDLEKEFFANLARFEQNDTNWICQFPARYRWMAKIYQWSHAEKTLSSCEDYQDFLLRLPAESVSLIFSAHYLNNPVSAFGHTFLKFNHQSGSGNELLDIGVDFAARVDSSNALTYGLKGIFGFFEGEFSLMPYAVKIRQYGSHERRDIFSYDLNLSEESFQRLVDHLWEADRAGFRYYYFDENCSYRILRVLEAADPSLDLSSKLPHWVIPSDTVKNLAGWSGLVKNVRYRPSIETRVLAQEKQTDRQKRDAARYYVDSPEPKLLSKFSTEENAQIIDLAIDLLELREHHLLQYPDSGPALQRRRLAILRSKLGRVPYRAMAEVEDSHQRPEWGHDSQRIELGMLRSNKRGEAFSFGYRAALHDWIDRGLGYPTHSTIEFLHLRALFRPERNHFSFEEATLFQVRSQSPVSSLVTPWSWRVRTGFRRLSNRQCENCFGFAQELGGGLTFEVVPGVFDFIAFVEAELSLATAYQTRFFRLSAGPAAGARFRYENIFSLFISAQSLRSPLGDNRFDSRLQSDFRWHLAKNFALKASNEWDRYHYSFGGGIHWFF